MDYFDLEEMLVDIIKKYPGMEEAAAQFNALLDDDEELKDNFSEWCVSKGYHEKKAFCAILSRVHGS